MNPWQQNLLDLCRNVIRFGLWFAVILDGLMLALFSIAFTAKFLWHLWTWCCRVLFTGSW